MASRADKDRPKIVDTKEDFTKSAKTMVRIPWTSITGAKKLKGGVAMDNLERMNFIAELAAAGKLKPVIDRSYPLERIAEAFTYAEQGHKKGNVVDDGGAFVGSWGRLTLLRCQR